MPGNLRGQLEEARRRREVEQREFERQQAALHNGDIARGAHQRILIVGPCASGKSALVEALRQQGYNAHSAAQEHSHVKTMWMMNKPSHLIYLEVGIEAIKQRRTINWGAEFLQEENLRLAHARAHADCIINTDSLTPEQVVARAITFLHEVGLRE
jgi:ABC-type phosphate/phosphonate transport system ATPase subunit